MTRQELARNTVQLAGLWGVAVAQPLFEVLESGEGFVVARWRGGDIVLFALAVAFLPPLVMAVTELAAARLARRLADVLHLIFAGGIAAILAAYVVKRQTDASGEVALLLAVLGGAAAAYALWRFAPVRSFVTLVGLAPPLFVALFLFGTPVRHLVLPAEDRIERGAAPRAPVVMVVFDEFPTLSLLDAKGDLDAHSFPEFARLAREATWYRNATTVADYTTTAVPAILTGRRGDSSRPPSAAAHPDNLLAFLGRRGGADAHEDVTRLCPGDVCAENAPRSFPGRIWKMLPSFGKVSLATFLPNALYRRIPNPRPFPVPWPDTAFAGLAAPDERHKTFHYLHVQLPHGPWWRLPRGRPYPNAHQDFHDFATDIGTALRAGFPSYPRLRWTRDQSRITHLLQRHLAQVQFADSILGRTLDRLRASGLYDRALVVVTADHGMSFVPGEDARRLSQATAPGVLPVPLFLKLPGQRRGAVSRRFVQSIDIAPTVAGALGLRLPWRADGRSLLAASVGEPDRIEATAVQTDEELTLAPRALFARVRSAAAAQAVRFEGRGADRIFRAGPHREAIGRDVRELGPAPPSGLRYELAPNHPPLEVRPGPFVPALIVGRLHGPGAAGRRLAVAVDGRVAATAVAYRSGAEVRFNAFLGDRHLREGPLRLQVYDVVARPGGVGLAPVPRAR